MFSDVFLAMTGSEIQQFRPAKAAYMACHFSSYGKGLSNLPTQLPENSLLLLDDSTPVAGHSPETVTEQLHVLIDALSPKALLLDFQRPRTRESDKIVRTIAENIGCPVAVTEQYSTECSCPVFLPPPPANRSLALYLAPFLKRGVYLEIAPEALEITVTGKGSNTIPLPQRTCELPLHHKRLCCHYDVQVSPGKATFTLHRSREDLAALTHQAYKMGVLGVVGLHQELSRLCTD